jgi:hypothetical protein
MTFLHKRPWLLVFVAFLILIAAWSSLIVVASKHRVEVIEVPTQSPHQAQ